MEPRKYSVAEIDKMRSAVAAKMWFGASDTVIEDRLRTYMANSVDPDELDASAAPARKAHEDHLQRMHEIMLRQIEKLA